MTNLVYFALLMVESAISMAVASAVKMDASSGKRAFISCR